MFVSLDVINTISYVTAAFGLLGSTFIITTYLLFKDSRNFGTQLVFCLSIADFVRGVSWYPWNVNDPMCIVQGVLIQFSEFAAFMWVFCIAMCLFQTYFLGASEERLQKLMVWFHIVCWGLPIIAAVVPFVGGKYGHILEDSQRCWIKDMTDPERLLLFIPCVLIFGINCIAFILIAIKVRKFQSFFSDKLQRNMAFYLLAFLLAQAPTIGNRLSVFIEPNRWGVLLLLQAIFQPLQGLFDAVAYGAIDPQFTMNYKRLSLRILRRVQYNNIQEGKASEFYFDYEYSSDSNYNKTYQARVSAALQAGSGNKPLTIA